MILPVAVLALLPAAAPAASHPSRILAEGVWCEPASGTPANCLRLRNGSATLDNPIDSGSNDPGNAEDVALQALNVLYLNKYPEYRLEFRDHPGICLGLTSGTGPSSGLTEVKDCSGPDPFAYGTTWAYDGTNAYFINVRVSNAMGSLQVLESQQRGAQCFLNFEAGLSEEHWAMR